MESDIRESRQAEAGRGRAMSGEKSPAGSVKRARQRAAAGVPQQQAQMPQYPTPLSVGSPRRSPQRASSPTNRARYPQYPPQGPSAPGNVPASASRPNRGMASPTGPQDFSRPGNPGARQDQNVGRGPAPQRPPRPNFVPPMPGSSQFPPNQLQPFQYRPPPPSEQQSRNYWEDGFTESSSSGRPLTTSTTSTVSSTGSIPDFPSTPAMPPAPLFQPPPRRNLGPPPSARKGGSSYYSQTSFVPPIPEEMSETHSSHAPSQVFAESWGDSPLEYYMGGGIDEEDEDHSQGGTSGRGSSAGDHDDSSGLVRRGSQGKPRMPFLETVDSGEESDRGPRGMRELDWQARQDERWRTGAPDTDPIGRHNFRADGRLNPQLYSGYESDATFLDSPRTQSPMPNLNPNQAGSHQYFGTPSPSASPIDPRVGQIMSHLEKGGALASSGTASPSIAPSINEKEFKRPPRLNLEASKGGPGRGSATSLPDLIRRATKLASNLDRGKTASRVGMLDLLDAKEKESKEKEKAAKGDGSISDILAAFPSPSPTTPTPHRPAGWPTPSPHGKSALSRAQTPGYGSSVSQRQRRRKCCGLPLWAFILLMIILLLLIAAAVIIPITLVVIPRNHKNNTPDISDCETTLPCANGGSSVVVDKKCRCICSNGFLGSSCNTPGDSSCTGTDIPGARSTTTYRNATLGDSIPRIFAASQSNFSIPIRSYTLLSLFSAANLSCASENALVTFGQKAQRRNLAQLPLPEIHSHQGPKLLSLEEVLTPPTKTHHHSSRTLYARASAQTTNGIIFAAPSVDTGGGTAPAPATSTAGAASPSSASNKKPVTQRVIDFSRTAVLFIFQETSSLTQTQTALDRLQAILSDGKTFDATQTSAGGNITVDLSALTVGFGNGTLYGGKGAM